MTLLPNSETTVAPTSSGRTRRSNITLIISFICIGLAFFAAIFGKLIFPNATEVDILTGVTSPMTDGRLFGTDDLGRDIAKLLVAGAGSALIGPVAIAAGSAILGILLGTLAGYEKGIVDMLVGRWTDLLLSLPVILMAIVVAGILGSGYWLSVALLAFLFSPGDIRIVRSGVFDEATRGYIEAGQMLQFSRWRIMFRHILPNVMHLVITNFMLHLSLAIVAMSSLSFLGIGVSQSEADWGRQITDSRSILAENPWAVFAPTLAIIAVTCAVNVVGDWYGSRKGNSVRKQG